jgi:hypothetical protein
MLRAATAMSEAPDLYVNSAVDPGSAEVAAFEPLVGSHGGIGGWQDRGFVLAPPGLFHPETPVVGGDELHRQFVAMLEALGQRTGLQAAAAPRPADQQAART